MKTILKLDDLQAILHKIEFKNWRVEVSDAMYEGYLLQWTFLEKDTTSSFDNNYYMQYCRKWYIENNATETKIIRTAWLAVQQAMMHEVAELFLYDNVRLFDPHTDYVKLAEYMKTAQQDKIE